MSDGSDTEQQMRTLESAAQRAAEERLEDAWTLLHNEDDQVLDHLSAEERERIERNLAGPFCGCMTCEVREVLDAAYPYLRDVVRLEVGLGPLVGQREEEPS